jgi:DNA-binding GntR family transcriptional regulator
MAVIGAADDGHLRSVDRASVKGASVSSSPQGASAASAEVVETLRRGILAGDLVPGQRLVELELSESLGVSRGAVRAALIDLAHTGLVERIANRGARVRVVSIQEALDITEVRMAVEGLCAAKAAERVSNRDVRRLQSLGERMRAAVDQGDVVGYSRLNQELHESVISLSAQPVAAEVLSGLRARNVRHQFRLAFRPGRPQQSLPEHLAIIEAICSRDPRAAEAAVRAHLQSVLEALREKS